MVIPHADEIALVLIVGVGHLNHACKALGKPPGNVPGIPAVGLELHAAFGMRHGAGRENDAGYPQSCHLSLQGISRTAGFIIAYDPELLIRVLTLQQSACLTDTVSHLTGRRPGLRFPE